MPSPLCPTLTEVLLRRCKKQDPVRYCTQYIQESLSSLILNVPLGRKVSLLSTATRHIPFFCGRVSFFVSCGVVVGVEMVWVFFVSCAFLCTPHTSSALQSRNCTKKNTQVSLVHTTILYKKSAQVSTRWKERVIHAPHQKERCNLFPLSLSLALHAHIHTHSRQTMETREASFFFGLPLSRSFCLTFLFLFSRDWKRLFPSHTTTDSDPGWWCFLLVLGLPCLQHSHLLISGRKRAYIFVESSFHGETDNHRGKMLNHWL